MKYVLLISLLIFSFSVKSQCCPYVNSIEVIPAVPTPLDVVKIVTTVTTPNQGNFISSSHSISGINIDIQACYFSGMLTATQTYTDTLEIGVLSIGNYVINLTAFQSGSDSICTYSDSMTSIANLTVIEPASGISELTEVIGTIYPNPSAGLFKVDLPNHFKASQIRIRSISGKIVYQSEFKNAFNLSLESGTYFIEFLEDEVELGHQRLVII